MSNTENQILVSRLRDLVATFRLIADADEGSMGQAGRAYRLAADSLEDILDAAPDEGPNPIPTWGMTVRLTDPKTGDLMSESDDGEIVSIEDAKRQLLELTDHWLYVSRFTPEVDVVQQAFWLSTLFWKITDAAGNVLEQGTIADIPRADHGYGPEEFDRR
jgi:hypothetical protein